MVVELVMRADAAAAEIVTKAKEDAAAKVEKAKEQGKAAGEQVIKASVEEAKQDVSFPL